MSELEQLVRELVRQELRGELARHSPQWEWLTVPQAADLLERTPKAVYSMFDRGVLTRHRFDGHVYVSRRELDLGIRRAA